VAKAFSSQVGFILMPVARGYVVEHGGQLATGQWKPNRAPLGRSSEL